MRFLSIDQHISVCADLRYIFNQLGHTVREVSLSGHAAVINRPIGNVPMLMGDGWCHTISKGKLKEFYDEYKNDIDKYDAIICCYPPIFSMLYKYFNKPIIIDMPIRYEYGADCDPVLWEEFNQYLKENVDSGKIILVANNRYDKRYAEGFLERPVEHIPSLCEYTGMSYNPVYEQFLYFSYFDLTGTSRRLAKKHAVLKAGHAWQTLADYRGCIHYPYNISTMSTFEQYTANIPLFFPTKRYILDMLLSGVPILHQISWQQCIQHGVTRTLIKCPFDRDPNNFNDVNCVADWVDYADFFGEDMKHIRHFDSVEERDKILSMSDGELLEISSAMRVHNVERRANVYDKWATVIGKIS